MFPIVEFRILRVENGKKVQFTWDYWGMVNRGMWVLSPPTACVAYMGLRRLHLNDSRFFEKPRKNRKVSPSWGPRNKTRVLIKKIEIQFISYSFIIIIII